MRSPRPILMPLAFAAIALGVLSGVPGCARSRPTSDDLYQPWTPGAVNHIVLFKLVDPADADGLVADSRKTLAEIPGVVSLFAGRRVDTGRAQAETDYDACVYVGFADTASYDAYVTHPRHTSLVGRWKERFEWYKVYDIADETFGHAQGR